MVNPLKLRLQHPNNRTLLGSHLSSCVNMRREGGFGFESVCSEIEMVVYEVLYTLRFVCYSQIIERLFSVRFLVPTVRRKSSLW